MSSGSRVSIFNLDAVEQARLWRHHGPTDATRMLVAAIRAALLMGEKVHVDRNQLLDGAFFISVSPDRLAWHLGLEPGAALPIAVQLLPPVDGGGPYADKPWRVADGGGGERAAWGVPDDVARVIRGNLRAVAAGGRGVVSSSSEAYVPGAARGVTVATAGEAYARTDHVVMPDHVWRNRSDGQAFELIERGREAWVEAMLHGRVEIVQWNAEAKPPEIAEHLRRSLAARDRHAESAGLPHDTAERLIAELLIAVTEATPDGTRRSLIVRWLNGETVPQLDPPRFDQALAAHGASVSYEERCRAVDLLLSWWIQGYYRAIAAREKLEIFQFHDTVRAHADDDSMRRLEEEWGLRPRAQRWWRRRRPGALNSDSTFAIRGDFVTHMTEYTPGQYARLRRFAQKHHDLRDDRKRTRQWLAELALATRDGAVEIGRRKRRIWWGRLRFGLLAAVGAVLAADTLMGRHVFGDAAVPVLFVALLVSSVPWGDLRTLWGMTEKGLRSTITLEPQ